jgi:hypothetical protein
MRPGLLILVGLGLLTSGCVSSPKETVLNLDTTDRRWISRDCVAARKAVARYDDRGGMRKVVRVVGNVAAPFAGTGASYALSAAQNDEREDLNNRVLRSCVSPPKKAPNKAPNKAPKTGKDGRAARR